MKHRILIIDDEPQLCEMLSLYLTDAGFIVRSAPSLQAAKGILSEPTLPSLMIVDVMLGDGNGLQFLKQLKQIQRTKKIPIVMMSAGAIEAKDRVMGLEFGADDYLLKPFDLKEMKLRIDRILKYTAERVTAVPQQPVSGASRSPSAPTHPEGTLESSIQKLFNKKEAPPAAPLPASESIEAHKPSTVTPSTMGRWWTRTLDVCLEPKNYFSTWNENEGLLQAVLWLSAGALAMGIQQGVAEKSFGVGMIQTVAVFFVMGGGAALAAWLVHWGLGLQHQQERFRSLVAVTGHFFAPYALGAVLGIFYVLLAHGKPGDFTVGPLLPFPAQVASAWMGPLFRRLDVFEIWGFVLVGLGFSKVLKFHPRKVFWWIAIVWVGALAVQMGLRGVFK